MAEPPLRGRGGGGGDPGSQGPPVPPAPAGAGEGRKGRLKGDVEFLMETLWKVTCGGVKGGGITPSPAPRLLPCESPAGKAVEAGGWERGRAPGAAFLRPRGGC